MKFSTSVALIPRNNWDYGFDALFGALANIRAQTTHAPNIERIFSQKPIFTTSGRSALYAILKALELPPGSRVGVPLFCCSVVFNAITQAGLTPCFIDSELEDCNISIEDLRRKRGDLAAVVPVHMFGNPCDMEAVCAAGQGLPVIEDCAQSILSTHQGRLTGTLSTASFFSFRCGKYISAGEGGAILCQEPALHKKVEAVVSSFESWSTAQLLTNALSTFVKATLYNRPWYGLVGHPVGMRLDKKLNLTAKDGFATGKIAPTHLALMESRLSHFEEKIEIQRKHARQLLDMLKPGNFSLPCERSGSTSNWFQFALRFQNMHQRDAMADYLLQQGIDTAKYLNTIVDEAREHYGYTGGCSNTEQLSKTILLVPIHYYLSDENISHIARSINTGSQSI